MEKSVSARSATRVKKKKKIEVPEAVLVANFSFQNTILSLTRPDGAVLFHQSAGMLGPGHQNSKRRTPYSAQLCVDKVLKVASEDYKVRNLELWTKKSGPGREPVIRSVLGDKNFSTITLVEKTPIEFGGRRHRKLPRK